MRASSRRDCNKRIFCCSRLVAGVANESRGDWPHAMRKTFANRVYHQLNHDLVKTQRAMGHKNINSTVAYLSFVEAEIDAAILAS
jgi:integrase